MYICLCNNVTDRQVRQAVRQGHHSLKSLRRELGITTQCARCAKPAQCLLRQTLAAEAATRESSVLPALAAAPA
jgi:bacterioferritin-associated ferredoxin